MGGSVKLASPGQIKRISVRIIGTDRIVCAQVVRNGIVLAGTDCDSERLDWTFEDDAVSRDGDFYYLRVRQEDDGRAWSSPVWIDLPTQ